VVLPTHFKLIEATGRYSNHFWVKQTPKENGKVESNNNTTLKNICPNR